MTELTIDRAIGRMIKRKFKDCFSWKASDKFYSGIPDRIVVMNGYFIGLEVKTATGKLSKIQEWTRGEIEKAGGLFRVVRSVKEAESFLLSTKRTIVEMEADGHGRT